jgi:adenosylhomocysteine nucleosidase
VITGIVVALPEELGTLTAKRIEKGCIEALAEKILVVCSGVGPNNASAAAQLLVKQGADRLISWGCAAALDAAFRPGDLVLAASYIDADEVEVNPGNMDWHTQVKDKLTQLLASPVHIGKLAESKNIVGLSLNKAAIGKATGAVALDMETVAVAKVAKLHGLPFLAMRAIADPLTMDLPKAVSHALNAQGEVVVSKLLLFLLLHPTELPSLLKLASHFNAAKKTLRLIAKQLHFIAISPQSTYPNKIQ